MSVRTALRLLRAAAFSTVCVALTALGHAGEAGHAVAPLALGVAVTLVFAVALVAGSRERSGAAITAGMLGSQVVLHLLFTEVGPGPAEMATMGAHAGTSCPDGAMPALHLGLALVAAWWLRRGEIACSRLLRRLESGTVAALRRALAPLTGIAVVADERPDGALHRPVRHEPGGCTTLRRARCAPRRGPPPARRPSIVGA